MSLWGWRCRRSVESALITRFPWVSGEVALAIDGRGSQANAVIASLQMAVVKASAVNNYFCIYCQDLTFNRNRNSIESVFLSKVKKMFDQLIENYIQEYRKTPRTKIFVDEQLLIASVFEETGKEVTIDQIRKIILEYIDGDLSEKQEVIYDGAVYACGVVARSCLGNDPEEDVDYEINWILNDDGSYIAEVRLC